jgi:phosphoglycolate phosphatase
MKKIIVFDLDGTLIDSDQITVSSINHIRKENELLPLPVNAITPFLATGGLELIQNTISNTNCKKINTDYLERLRAKMLQTKTEESILFPNVKFALEKLIKSNINLCICTNKGSLLVNKILSDLKIFTYFKNIVADGDLDTRKPHKNNFIASMRDIKYSKSECLIIGDSSVDLELSKNAGVDFLAYNNKTNTKFIKSYGGLFFDDYNQLPEYSLIKSNLV